MSDLKTCINELRTIAAQELGSEAIGLLAQALRRVLTLPRCASVRAQLGVIFEQPQLAVEVYCLKAQPTFQAAQWYQTFRQALCTEGSAQVAAFIARIEQDEKLQQGFYQMGQQCLHDPELQAAICEAITAHGSADSELRARFMALLQAVQPNPMAHLKRML